MRYCIAEVEMYVLIMCLVCRVLLLLKYAEIMLCAHCNTFTCSVQSDNKNRNMFISVQLCFIRYYLDSVSTTLKDQS